MLSASTYDERVQEVRVAAAGVEVSRSAVQTAELDLEFTRITAPVSGRVSQHEVGIGNLITGGTGGTPTLLTTIVSLDPIYFDFDMSESDFLAYQRAYDAGLMASSATAGVRPCRPACSTSATGRSRAHRTSSTTRWIAAAGTDPRPRGLRQSRRCCITPGQFGRIRLPGSEPYTAILIPDSAIVTDQSQQDRPDRGRGRQGGAQDHPARPDSRTGLRIIRDGLEPTDRIIINGIVARPARCARSRRRTARSNRRRPS